MALLVSFGRCAQNMALGTLKVGRWSRKAGGRCIRCSFCTELFVHGKTVIRSRWSLKTEVAYTRFYCGRMEDVSPAFHACVCVCVCVCMCLCVCLHGCMFACVCMYVNLLPDNVEK